MKYTKYILYLAACIALGLGVGQALLWWRSPSGHSFERHERPIRVTGSGQAPAERGFHLRQFDSRTFPALLDRWGTLRATSVGLEYGAGVSREQLILAAKWAHERNFSVVLLPPRPAVGNPYPRPLAEVAGHAEDARIEYLCISWLESDTDAPFWRQQATAVRRVFKGKVILAASYDWALRVDCWDASDLIGIIGPIPFARRLPSASDEVTPADLRSAWASTIGGLESLADRHQKHLALLQANVPLAVSLKMPRPPARDLPPTLNPDLQRMLYEALFLETKAENSRHQVLLFDWGNPGEYGAVNHSAGLLDRLADTWDPGHPAGPVGDTTVSPPAKKGL